MSGHHAMLPSSGSAARPAVVDRRSLEHQAYRGRAQSCPWDHLLKPSGAVTPERGLCSWSARPVLVLLLLFECWGPAGQPGQDCSWRQLAGLGALSAGRQLLTVGCRPSGRAVWAQLRLLLHAGAEMLLKLSLLVSLRCLLLLLALEVVGACHSIVH